MRVEFASQPPVFEIAPTINGLVILRFYEDVKATETEDGTRFDAVCYETVVPNTANLYDRIDKNLGAWLAKAKADTEKRAEEVIRIERRNAVPERVEALERGIALFYRLIEAMQESPLLSKIVGKLDGEAQ